MTAFRPMAAARVADLGALRYPLRAAPLLEGVRAQVSDDGQLVGEDLEPIANPYVRGLYGRPALAGLDGYLVCGSTAAPDVFKRTRLTLMARAGNVDVTYYATDWRLDESLPFEERARRAQNVAVDFGQVGPSYRRVKFVLYARIADADEFAEYADITRRLGYRGVVLRSPRAPYRRGRCTLRSGEMMEYRLP